MKQIPEKWGQGSVGRRVTASMGIARLAILALFALILIGSHPVVAPAAHAMRSATHMMSAGSDDLANPQGNSVQHNPRAYVIFWGADWSTNPDDNASAQATLNYFQHVGGTAYADILTQYYDGSGHINGRPTLAGSAFDINTPPTDTVCGPNTVEDLNIRREYQSAGTQHGWTTTPDTTYFVFVAPGYVVYGPPGCSNIALPGKDRNCGYHEVDLDHTVYAAVPFPIAFPGDTGCIFSGRLPTEQLVSDGAHEQFEAITDPQLHAWRASDGREIADLCASHDAFEQIGTTRYELQQMYSNATSQCESSYPPEDEQDQEDVYAVGTNGHLYDYHWHEYLGWSTTDLNSATHITASITGSASGHTAIQTGQLLQDVFATGTDGKLYQFFSYNGVWQNNYPLSPPAGVTFTGSPTAFSYTLYTFFGQPILHHSVFVMGSNGDLYNLAWTEGGSWTTYDLTANLGPGSNAFPTTAKPTAHAFTVSGSSTIWQDVFAVSNAGDVIQYWWDGSAWHENNLRAYGYPTGGVHFVGAPSAFSNLIGTCERHNVFVEGSDGQLYTYQWSQCGTWTLTSLGNDGVSLTGSPSAHAVTVDGILVYDTFERGTNGRLYERWWHGGNNTWYWTDISAAAGATGVTVVSSPSGYSLIIPSGPGVVRHSVFVVTSNGHLQQFYWTRDTTAWGLYDQGVPSSSLTSDPDAHSYGALGNSYGAS